MLKLTASGGATPAVAIGESTTKTLTLKNPTTSSVTFTIAVSNQIGLSWSVGTTTCTGTLAAGKSCAINFVFAPAVAGAASATAVVTDTSGAVASQPLESSGLKHFTIAPSTGSFGYWAVGSTSPSQTFTVTNNHVASISINSVDISNTDFVRTGGTCASTIGAKGTCTVNVAYAPRSAGLTTSSGVLTVAVTGMGSQTASLSGQKVVAIGVAPSPVAFGKVATGTSATAVVTITNRASIPISLSQPSLSVLGQYSITATTCTAAVAASSTCTITVRFAPTSVGDKFARLLISYIEGGATVEASDNLTGTGITTPRAPTSVSAAPADRAATVSWTAPAVDGGSPITGYQVIAHSGGTDGTPKIVDAATTSTSVTGLTNGTPYTFTVIATNAAGSGAASAPSAPVTPAVPGPDCGAIRTSPPNSDFHGCNFSGANFDGSLYLFNFSGDNFAGANFSNARMILVNANNANFTGANLSGANLDGTQLSGTDLTGANLNNTQFISIAYLDNVETQPYGVRSSGITGTPATMPDGWTLSGGYLLGPGAVVPNAQLQGADLHGVYLANADLTGAQLNGANLTDADLAGASMFGTFFANADLSGANLSGGNLVLAGFDHANLTGANLAGANLFHADLTGATLTGVRSGNIQGPVTGLPAGWSLVGGYLIGPGAQLDGAQLSGAQLGGVDLSNADLSGANLFATFFGNANLTGANLTGANLVLANVGANLTNANLTGANMSHCDLTGANFTGATLDGVITGGCYGPPAALPHGWIWDGSTGTLVAAALPTAPTIISATAGGGGITLTWTAPAIDPRWPIQSYTVTPFDGTTALAPVLVVGPANTTQLITGLANGVSYTFTVAATNLVGTGNASAPSATVIAVGDCTARAPGVDLSGCDLHGEDLSGVDLASSLLVETNLSGALVVGADFGFADARRANFSHATLDNSYLGLANLTGADLSFVHMFNGSFHGAVLAGVDLSGADLYGVELVNADLTGANLSGAVVDGDLTGANLTGANLTGADLSSATFCNTTMPDGSRNDDDCSPPECDIVCGVLG